MPFKKGQRHPNQGGPQKGSGRPTREQAAVKKTIAEKVQAYLDKHIDPVLETYKDNAAGHTEKRYTESGKEYEVQVVDLATTRHYIDKFVPAAKQQLEISGGLKIVKVDAFDPSKVK